MSVVYLVVSHFGFEDGTVVLIAQVPGHCLLFTVLYPLSVFASCQEKNPKFSLSLILFPITLKIVGYYVSYTVHPKNCV